MNEHNYYAAPQAELGPELGANPWAGAGAAPLATRGARFLAVILDSLVWVPVVIPVAAGLVLSDGSSEDVALMLGMILTGAMSVGLIVYTLYLLATNGQTVGKKIMGIKIVRNDLQTPASFWRIVGMRYLPIWMLGFVPFLGSFLQLGSYGLIFGAEQRCGHDYIADTHVVVDTGPAMDGDVNYGSGGGYQSVGF